MKQLLVGSWLGRAGIRVRAGAQMLHAALCHPDTVGTIANDQLATRLVSTLCRSGKTFIDVGAHIGSVLAAVAHADPTVRLVAIEAIPSKAAGLRRRFPNAELHECAAGESTGEVPFFVDTRRSGYSSLTPRPSAASAPVEQIRVPIRRLDDLVERSDVDVIKIDVEGAELGVLRGGTRILEGCRPVVMFESGPKGDDDLGYTKEAMYAFVTSIDYVILVPNRVAHEGPGMTLDGFVESHLFPRRTTNYFAVPRARQVEVRDRARSLLGVR